MFLIEYNNETIFNEVYVTLFNPLLIIFSFYPIYTFLPTVDNLTSLY